jgi:serine protease
LVIQEAVQDAVAVGVLVVAAAGNQGSPQPSFPAGSEEVVSVGALAWDLDRANYSNHGSTVEIMAPGGEYDPGPGGEARGLLSTMASNVGGALQFDYGYRFGTSMATPQVAGVAALMWSINPGLSVRQVRSILRETANDLGDPGRDDQFGYGLLDAAAAVTRAAAEIGEAGRPPRLALSPSVLDFGTERTAMTIEVDNEGDGVIVVDRITPREQVGSGWLSVEAGTGASSAEPRIDVTVDRSQLPAGPFFGQIEVTASGVAFSTVEVYGVATGSPGHAGRISVTTLDPESGAVDTRTFIADVGDGTFVPQSRHFERVLLYAGTDRDGDGLICEPQDACGAWPSLLNPLEVATAELPTAAPIEIAVYEPPAGSGWPAELLP